MPSYRAFSRTVALSLILLHAGLVAPRGADAAGSAVGGSGATASASIDFRVVIPARLQLRLAERADGSARLDARMYSRRGTLTVTGGDARGPLADGGVGNVLKNASLETRGGVYTIASP